MQNQQNGSDSAPVAKPSFQYSLLTLFVLTTVLGVAFSLLFASPGWVRLLSALCVVVTLPAVLTVMLIYGRGYGRTFAIGALFPSGMTFCSTALVFTYATFALGALGYDHWDEFPQFGHASGVFVVFTLGLSIAVGLLAVVVRRKVEAPGRQKPEASLPAGASVERQEGQANWRCGSCGQTVPRNFDACWNCNTARADGTNPSDPEVDNAPS